MTCCGLPTLQRKWQSSQLLPTYSNALTEERSEALRAAALEHGFLLVEAKSTATLHLLERARFIRHKVSFHR